MGSGLGSQSVNTVSQNNIGSASERVMETKNQQNIEGFMAGGETLGERADLEDEGTIERAEQRAGEDLNARE